MDILRLVFFRRLASIVRLTVGFVFVSLCSIVTLLVAVLLLPSRVLRIKLCNAYGKVVGPVILWLAGATPHVTGRERIAEYRPAIYVSNHTSTLDTFVAIWLCPIGGCGIAKKEVLRIPFFGWLYLLSGHMTIDRADRAGAISVMTETAEFVRKNRLSMWLWPEGTRSKDGRLLPLKKGFFHIALATRLPIVPIVVHRAHENWKKHGFTFVPIDLNIDVLPAISTAEWKPETADQHIAEVHTAFANALGETQKPVGSHPETTAVGAGGVGRAHSP